MPSKKQRARNRRLREECAFETKIDGFADKIVDAYERQCDAFTQLLRYEKSGQFEGCYRRVYDRAIYRRALKYNLSCDSEYKAYEVAVQLLNPEMLTHVLQIADDAPVLSNMRALGVAFHPLFMCAMVQRDNEPAPSLQRYFAVLLTRERKLGRQYNLGNFGNDLTKMHSLKHYADAMLFVNFTQGTASVLPYECFLKNKWFSVDTIFLAEVVDNANKIVPFKQIQQLYSGTHH